ncbi:sugar transferase [Oleidesulfovibrio sp.]|uniref:sugar transferase n=1 Tax=Oleidesulfovibrio sp. TaxID=2909707 RepID=UPI003A848815
MRTKVLLAGNYAPALLLFRGEFIRGLVAAGHDVVCTAPENDAETRAALAELGVRYRIVPLRRTGMNPVYDLITFFSYLWTFLEERPDVVLTSSIKPVIYGGFAAWLARVPRKFGMITGLGYAFTHTEGIKGVLNKLVKGLCRAAMPRYEAIFFLNPDDKNLFASENLISRTKHVVLNGEGVNLDHYAYCQPQTEPPEFLLIARLLKAKGVPEFCEAAIRLKKRYPHAVFRLVGWHDKGPDSIEDADLARWTAGGVQYDGSMADVRPALCASSVYVLPSHREGTPRSTMEAMSTGRAIVTTDAPGCRETVKDGVNGYMVPVHDIDALEKAMERFITTPELITEMGRQSRTMAEERYNVREVNRTIFKTMRLPEHASAPRLKRSTSPVIKRAFDLALAIPAFVVFLPVMAVVALTVRVKLSRDIFFRQVRPGTDGKPFTIIKFRTMTDECGPDGKLLPDEQRLTRFGKFLRASSLDELPELWNVIKGEMSLVGPRPLLMQYLPLYTPRQATRMDVRPGITGWAQVNGRNAVDWDAKLEMDAWYVENHTIWLDLRILFLTVWKVFRSEGVSKQGHATTDVFTGSKK